MQGFIFLEFRNYVMKQLKLDVWDEILKKMGVGPKMYVSLLGYPDQEFHAMMKATSEISGKTIPFLFEDFGIYLVQGFLRITSHKIDPKWNSIDIIERIPIIFRHVLISAFVGSLPPLMKFVRNSPDEVAIYYTSPRKLCMLGIGTVKGIANFRNEKIKVTELSCMHKGDPQCQIIVKLVPTTTKNEEKDLTEKFFPKKPSKVGIGHNPS